ncbi:MAG TPA: Hsp33 family molecular chaperone HslO [Candidatus Ozemobacteraceae bacterium]
MDYLLHAYSPRNKIFLSIADVTETARQLEQMHLSGPTAGRFLGEGLVAAALLSTEISEADERISFQLQVDGPVGGCMFDVSTTGTMRGYTHKKLFNEFDGQDTCDMKSILGSYGRLTVIRSNRRGAIDQQQVQSCPADVRSALASYFNIVLRRPVAIELVSNSVNATVARASGARIERTRDADVEQFVPLLERFNDRSIRELLANSADITTYQKLLGLDDLRVLISRELRFGCGCSYEKVVASVGMLGVNELRDIVEKKEAQTVTCHFCGNTYIVSPEAIAGLIMKMSRSDNEPKP